MASPPGAAPPDPLKEKREALPGGSSRPVAVIVGAGLTGSMLAEMDLGAELLVLVDDDRIEAATRLAPAFAGSEPGGLKVEALARSRARFAWCRSVALALRAEELGGGFWRWLRAAPGIVLDATDRAATHGFLGRTAKRYGLPLAQTGVWDWQALVRVFPAGAEAACWRCLGLPESPDRQSCLTGTVEANPLALAASPTVSQPAAAAAAAALVLGLTRQPPPVGASGREWRMDLTTGTLQLAELPRAVSCDHAPAGAEVVAVPWGSNAPLGLAFAVARDQLGGAPALRPEGPVAGWLGCAECGWHSKPRPHVLGRRLWRCENCGSDRLVAPEGDLREALAEPGAAELSARELGLPWWPELVFQAGEREVRVILAGDAERLLPGVVVPGGEV